MKMKGNNKMNEQEKTLAAYKEYLLECANNDSLDFTAINKRYEFKMEAFTWSNLRSGADNLIFFLHPENLFRRKKRTVVVNGKTVPAPMDREPKKGDSIYYLDSSEDGCFFDTVFSDTHCDQNNIRAGWFDNEQDASEYFKALLGIK
jgi:hypothetical protein